MNAATAVALTALAFASLMCGARAAAPAPDVRIAVTGEARRADGHVLAYAVSVFRYVPRERALTPQARDRATVFVATCTLSDTTSGRHVTAQRFGRFGFDRVSASGDAVDADLAGWSLHARTVHGTAAVRIAIDDVRLHLQLDARGAFAAGMPFVPPMRTTGRIDGADVRGHSTFAIDTRPALVDGAVADRFVAVLHITGSQGVHTLRIVRFTNDDAQTQVTMIDPDGRVTRFGRADVRMRRVETYRWISPVTPFAYPTLWQITIVPLNVFVSISPAITNQEFVAVPRSDSFWEGAVLVEPLDPVRQVYGRGIVTASALRTGVPTP